jgi:hypothetical protein
MQRIFPGVAGEAAPPSAAQALPSSGPSARSTGRPIFWPMLTAANALATLVVAACVAVILLRQGSDEQRWRHGQAALDAVWRLDEEWKSAGMVASRNAAAAGLLAGEPTRDVDDVLDFFDEIAFLADRGALQEEMVWYRFYRPLASYWSASQEYLRGRTSEWQHLGDLLPRLATIERQHHKDRWRDGIPSKNDVREFLDGETDAAPCESGADQEAGNTLL